MIPKKIHYCWFGGNELDETAKKCIESWKLFLPDYEIIEWNESNFDVNQSKFTQQAYQMKKFAFVSDYVRLFALYHHGGIYMDTDVEVIQSLDRFLKHKAFTGNEDKEHCVTGTIGAEKQHPWIKTLFDYYEKQEFKSENGNLNIETNTSLITDITSLNFGWRKIDSYQVLSEDLHIYPSEYFCAKSFDTGNYHVTKNTYTIHHFNGSWLTKKQKIGLKVRRVLKNKKLFK